jgi:hypothetical protein
MKEEIIFDFNRFSIWFVEQDIFVLSTQEVIIEYVPWLLDPGKGQVTIWLAKSKIGTFNMSLDSSVALDPTEGSAFVGFTGSHSAPNDTYPGETITLHSWQFSFTGTIQATNCVVFGLDFAEAGAGLVFYLQTVDQFGNNMTTYPFHYFLPGDNMFLDQVNGSKNCGTITNYTDRPRKNLDNRPTSYCTHNSSAKINE